MEDTADDDDLQLALQPVLAPRGLLGTVVASTKQQRHTREGASSNEPKTTALVRIARKETEMPSHLLCSQG
jgi:hypothetical protein